MQTRWAHEEFETIDPGDKRLNKRVVLLAQMLGDKPGASIAAACEDWAQTAAAYRLLAHDNVGWSDVIQAHGQATLARIRQQRVVLCLQDTTELNYQGRAMRGLGPLRTCSRSVARGHQPVAAGAEEPECTLVHEDSEHRPTPDHGLAARS